MPPSSTRGIVTISLALRLLTMVLSPFGWEPLMLYRVNAWISWLMPLTVLELANWLSHGVKLPRFRSTQSQPY